MELDDPTVMLIALRRVARAHGMAEVTRRADVGEKTLFSALSEKGNPTLATVNKVLHAVGLRLSVAPIAAPTRAKKAARPKVAASRRPVAAHAGAQ
jgi:probable addiction module antidote protein